MTYPSSIRKWLAFGTGAGIEVGARDLRVTLVRVRPSGVEILGFTTIEGFIDRPAAEWGREYAEFLKRHGARHLSAAVVLPRTELVVRHLALPGVAARDIAPAIAFQVDSLHPYPEDSVAWTWSRAGAEGHVLVGILRRDALERYVTLFTEAGIKVASFTFSGAALHAAIRLLGPARSGFVTVVDSDSGLEAYGESESKPVFSAAFHLPRDKALALASAELRLDEGAEPVPVEDVLPRAKRSPEEYDFSRNALAYAAALAGACPRLALPFNLLPPEHRTSTSRARFVPTAALALLLAGTLAALAAVHPIEDRKYQAALQAEIARLEPQASKAGDLDRAIEQIRQRTRMLDEFRSRTKADLDAIAELTRILKPPSWLNSLELGRDSAILTGMTEQAETLLKVIDDSPLFQGSEFTVPLSRAGRSELFRVQIYREGKGR